MTNSTDGLLTAREVECLRGVAQHKRTKAIAAELNLAPKTVDTYIANAARKLGVGDRDSAVRAWLADGAAGIGADPALGDVPELSPSAKTEVATDAAAASSRAVGRLPWPVPTRENPRNDLTVAQSLVWIVVLGALMLSAMTLYLLGIRMLSEHL